MIEVFVACMLSELNTKYSHRGRSICLQFSIFTVTEFQTANIIFSLGACESTNFAHSLAVCHSIAAYSSSDWLHDMSVYLYCPVVPTASPHQFHTFLGFLNTLVYHSTSILPKSVQVSLIL